MSSCLFSAVIHLELDSHDRIIVPIRGLFPHPEDGGREGSLEPVICWSIIVV